MTAVTMHHFSGLSAPFVRSKGTVSGGVFIYTDFCNSEVGNKRCCVVYEQKSQCSKENYKEKRELISVYSSEGSLKATMAQRTHVQPKGAVDTDLCINCPFSFQNSTHKQLNTS